MSILWHPAFGRSAAAARNPVIARVSELETQVCEDARSAHLGAASRNVVATVTAATPISVGAASIIAGWYPCGTDVRVPVARVPNDALDLGYEGELADGCLGWRS